MNRGRLSALVFLLAVFCLGTPAPQVRADSPGRPSPADTLNGVYEEVRAIVAAEKGKVPEEKINNKLRGIIAPMFDFEELTRRSLGAAWRQGTPEQQKEIVFLLSDLLARTYLKRITRGVELISVSTISEKVEGDKATVFATVIAKGLPVSTMARLHFTKGGWKVYDVAVEGIGLVTNYRNEFPGIVRKEGFEGLLGRLREKHAKNIELPVNPARQFAE